MRAKSVSNNGGTIRSLPLSGFSLRIAPLILRYETAAKPLSEWTTVSTSILSKWGENIPK